MCRGKRVGLLLILVTVLFTVSGCGEKLPYDASRDLFYINGTAIPAGTVRILFYAMQQQENEAYRDLYGEDFWNRRIFSDSDMTYAQYQKERVFYEEFMNMAALSLIWNEQGELPAEEQERIETAAGAYYDSLPEEEKTFLSVSRQDVTGLFRMYACASLEKKKLEDQVNTEVSDEEARVLTVQMAVFEKQEDAVHFLEKAEEQEGNFDDLAAEYPAAELRTDYVSKESAYSQALLKELFSAKEGDCCGVFSEQGAYLVMRLKESYNEERSELRRKRIVQERLQAGWSDVCKQYLEDAQILISEPLWEELHFTSDSGFPDDSIYQYLAELTEDQGSSSAPDTSGLATME